MTTGGVFNLIVSLFLIFITYSGSVLFCNRSIYYLLDLDDNENFLVHPFLTFNWMDPSLCEMIALAISPVLGVIEPISAIFRVSILKLVNNQNDSAKVMFLIGCILHSINCLLFVFILNNLSHIFFSKIPTSPSSTNLSDQLRHSSIVGSLWWGLHPLRGEVIGWLSCQSYLLMTCFAFFGVLMTLSNGRFHHVWSLIFFMLACGSKAAVVTLPCYLIIIEFMKLILQCDGHRKELSLRTLIVILKIVFTYIPHFAVSMFTIYATHQANTEVDLGPTDLSFDSGLFWAPVSLSLTSRVVKALFSSLFFYPLKIIYPLGLRLLYLTPRHGSYDTSSGRAILNEEVDMEISPSMLLMILLLSVFLFLFVLIFYFKQINSKKFINKSTNDKENIDNDGVKNDENENPVVCPSKVGTFSPFVFVVLLYSISWFVLLLPTLGLTPHGWTLIGADRYTYLPQALAITPMFSILYHMFGQRISSLARNKVSKKFQLVLWYFSWVSLIICQVISLQPHVNKWSNSDQLWRQVAHCHPNLNNKIHQYHIKAPFSIQSYETFTEEIETSSYNYITNNNEYNDMLLQVVGRTTTSSISKITHWPMLGSYSCPDVIALYNLARILQKDDPRGAILVYLQALKSDIAHGGAWNNLGSLIQSHHIANEKDENFLSLLKHIISQGFINLSSEYDSNYPDHDKFHDYHGGKKMLVKENVKLLFSFINTKQELKNNLLQLLLAEICYRNAILLNPDTHATAHNNLGKLLHGQGSYLYNHNHLDDDEDDGGLEFENEAMRCYKRAIAISSSYSKAWFNLGLLQLRHGKHADSIEVIESDDDSNDDVNIIKKDHIREGYHDMMNDQSSLFPLTNTNNYLFSHHSNHINHLKLKLSPAMFSFQNAYLKSELFHQYDVLIDSYLKLADLLLKSKIYLDESLFKKKSKLNLNNNNVYNDDELEEGEEKVQKDEEISLGNGEDKIFKVKLVHFIQIDIFIESLRLFQKVHSYHPKDTNVLGMIKFIENKIKKMKIKYI